MCPLSPKQCWDTKLETLSSKINTVPMPCKLLDNNWLGCVQFLVSGQLLLWESCPDNKVHGPNMGHIWGWQDPGGPHVGPMNFAVWVDALYYLSNPMEWLLTHWGQDKMTTENIFKCILYNKNYHVCIINFIEICYLHVIYLFFQRCGLNLVYMCTIAVLRKWGWVEIKYFSQRISVLHDECK